jgi:hypothetical protein
MKNVEYMLGYDCSGSTQHAEFYHRKTQEIVENVLDKHEVFLESSSNVIRLRWDGAVVEMTKRDLFFINTTKRGYGGTYPEVLVDYIVKNNFHGVLVLITDGQISPGEVRKCSEQLMDWKFKKVFVYIMKTSFYGNIEESISCAFVRNSPHVIEIYNNNGELNQNVVEITRESFAILEKLDSITDEETFLSFVPELDNLLMSINMGTQGNSKIKDTLVKLKRRIIQRKSDNIVGVSEISDVVGNPTTENLARVWNLYYYGSSSWEKTIDKYISWCSGSLLNTFDRQIINRERLAEVVPPAAPEIIELLVTNSNSSIIAECPILMADSCNFMILIRKKDSLFQFLGQEDHKDLKELLTNCPLNALNHAVVLDYMKGLLDNVISIEAYKELIEHGISAESPLTREDIIGGICLGSHESHVKFSNSVMRQCLTNGKHLGNIDLWFAVIYMMIVEKRLVSHLDDYVPNIREHMIYRLENSTTYMCLSGLPTFPTYRVPLKIALWSVLSASAVTDNPRHEPIRLHLSYASVMFHLIGLVGLFVPEGITGYINRLECLRWLLYEKKKGNREKIENIVEALRYNFLFLKEEDRFIYLDGMPTEQQTMTVKVKLPGMFDLLSREEILHLNKICDTNKAEADIVYHMKTKPDTNIQIGSKIWNYEATMPYSKVDICEATCRPYYYVDYRGGKKWTEKAKEIYGKERHLISLNELFGNYICKNNAYPTKNAFLVFLSDYFGRRNKKTLPMCMSQFLEELFDEYKEIMEKVSVKDFIERWKRTSEIEEREFIENVWRLFKLLR